MPATNAPIGTHDHLNPAVQAEAFRLYYGDNYPGRTGMSWNEVAALLNLAPTTEGGYSVARWAAYQERNRLGLNVRQPRPARSTDEIIAALIERRFGIEIEFNRGTGGGYSQQANIAATAAGLGIRVECEGYNHETRNYWKMTTDATVSGGELVSPPMRTSEGLRQVRLALRAIKEHGGVTGRNCGMHVHHDVTDFTVEQMRVLVRNLRATERAFMAFVPPCRIDGSNHHSAMLIADRGWQTLEANVDRGSLTYAGRTRENRGYGAGITRYASVNFNSVLTYGTVEFRGLGNTLNITKIQPWVKVTQALVEFSRLGLRFEGPTTTEEMLAALRGARLIDAATKRAFLRHATADRQAAITTQAARAA